MSLLLFVGFLALVILFISWQIADVAENASQLEQQLMAKYQQLRQWLSTEYGISKEQQEQMLKEQQASSSGKAGAALTAIISGFGGFLTDFLLVLVYVFLFTFFRGRIRGFICVWYLIMRKKRLLPVFIKLRNSTAVSERIIADDHFPVDHVCNWFFDRGRKACILFCHLMWFAGDHPICG
ncbi:AI-2E family transporter [Chitinophaga pinensis]|uniref:AI-2E family transporter n=1 Tax=Chitinophaga pinensis TaxID=79329 RepID=UPI001649543C|nr:AI-2E family transporter [Chitinophaga pinensis]